MKILHVGPLKGGVDAFFRIILANIGDGFEFVVINGADDECKPYVRNNHIIQSYRIVANRSLNPIRDAWALLQVIWIIWKVNPDMVHCHSAKGGVIGRTAAFLTGKKCVYTPHAFSFFAANSQRLKKIYLWIEKWTRFRSWLIGCSETERMLGVQQVGYSEEKAFRWNNSIPEVHTEEIKRPLGLSSDEKYIVTIARPSYQKNTLMMVEIMNKIHQICPDLKLYLLGAGDNVYAPMLDEMKVSVRKYGLSHVIHILPWLPHEEALGYIKYAQLYLTTSQYEGLPISVLEAMALGKAIVASDVVGNRDCIKDGYSGILLPLDVDRFVDKIVNLLNKQEEMVKLGRQARASFESDFFIEKQIGGLEAIYSHIGGA